MTITDEDLAKELHESYVKAARTGHMGTEQFLIVARLARRLLCPPSEEELRLKRGEEAYNAHVVPKYSAKWSDLMSGTKEDWCRVADAVLATKAEQDKETT